MRLGATTACTKRMVEATKGIGHRGIKGSTKDCFIFDGWFFSKKSAETAMDVGAYIIGIIKTNTKLFCKETIDNLTKYWSGGSHIVLRSKLIVPGDRPLIDIGYKYNAR